MFQNYCYYEIMIGIDKNVQKNATTTTIFCLRWIHNIYVHFY